MENYELEDLIKGISLCFEQNYFAMPRSKIREKFRNVDETNLNIAIEAMKRRRMLIYDIPADKYRLVLR